MQRIWMACPAMQGANVGMLLEILRSPHSHSRGLWTPMYLFSPAQKLFLGPRKKKKGTSPLGYVRRVYKVIPG